MEKIINCVLLIDDDIVTNFYNKKIVKKHSEFKEIITVNSGKKALDYLEGVALEKNKKPNLILLDINMPAMNGWEFLIEYEKLDTTITNGIKLIMLTTSANPDDYKKSQSNTIVDDFVNKPLSVSILDDIITTHYKKLKIQ